MKHAVAKIVLKLLHFEQKQRRMDIAQKMLTTFNDDSNLPRKLTIGDESWALTLKLKLTQNLVQFL